MWQTTEQHNWHSESKTKGQLWIWLMITGAYNPLKCPFSFASFSLQPQAGMLVVHEQQCGRKGKTTGSCSSKLQVRIHITLWWYRTTPPRTTLYHKIPSYSVTESTDCYVVHLKFASLNLQNVMIRWWYTPQHYYHIWTLCTYGSLDGHLIHILVTSSSKNPTQEYLDDCTPHCGTSPPVQFNQRGSVVFKMASYGPSYKEYLEIDPLIVTLHHWVHLTVELQAK